MIGDQNIGISFCFHKRRVLIHRATLRSLGMSKNIRFLLNMKMKKIAVQVCEAIDRDSFKVPKFEERFEQYEIYSTNFVKMIYNAGDWDTGKTYRIRGKLYPDNRLVEFEIGKSEVILEEEFVDPESGIGDIT